MLNDVIFNPYFVQIENKIRNDFGKFENYNQINNDLKNIYNSLLTNTYNSDYDKYNNDYVNLYNDYSNFLELCNDQYNYKRAFSISKLFISITNSLYLFIKNKYGYKKNIAY